MSKNKNGICHICGKYDKLSYEHTPPKAAFNNSKRRLSTLDALLKDEIENRAPWDIDGLRYKQFQNGIGFHTLCKSCNNVTGGKYGGKYSSFINSVGIEIMKIPKDERSGALTFRIEPLNLLAIFKQVLTMFCSLNTAQFGVLFKNFLLDETSNDFPCDNYIIYMYLHAGKAD